MKYRSVGMFCRSNGEDSFVGVDTHGREVYQVGRREDRERHECCSTHNARNISRLGEPRRGGLA